MLSSRNELHDYELQWFLTKITVFVSFFLEKWGKRKNFFYHQSTDKISGKYYYLVRHIEAETYLDSK